jgi:hypothetical protein
LQRPIGAEVRILELIENTVRTIDPEKAGDILWE